MVDGMRSELIVFLEMLIGLFGLSAGQSLVKKDADLLLEKLVMAVSVSRWLVIDDVARGMSADTQTTGIPAHCWHP